MPKGRAAIPARRPAVGKGGFVMRASVQLSACLWWLVTFAALVAVSCGGNGGARTTALHWFSACGDPVCMSHRDHGVEPCTTEPVGEPCSPEGARCDPGDSC